MENIITIDSRASEELKSILSSMAIYADTIRIFISGMACHGPMFNIAKDEQKENDYAMEFEGIKYVADKALMEEFGGFEIQYLEEDSFHGLYVKPQIMPDNGGGCSSCGGGCH